MDGGTVQRPVEFALLRRRFLHAPEQRTAAVRGGRRQRFVVAAYEAATSIRKEKTTGGLVAAAPTGLGRGETASTVAAAPAAGRPVLLADIHWDRLVPVPRNHEAADAVARRGSYDWYDRDGDPPQG